MAPAESVTRTRNFLTPRALALPETTPDFDRVIPLGNEPFDRFQV